MEKKRKPFEILCMCIGIFLCLFAFIIVGTLLLGPVIMRPNPSVPMDSYDQMEKYLKRDPDILIIPEDIIPDGANAGYHVSNWSRRRIIHPDGYRIWVGDENHDGIFEIQVRDRERTPQFHGHKEFPTDIDSAGLPLSLYIENGKHCYHFYTDTHLYTISLTEPDEDFEENLCNWLNEKV